MEAELARSMKGLRLEGEGPPYFLLYRLVERRVRTWSASLGAPLGRSEREERTLYVEARVGSPKLDNTGPGYNGVSSQAPREGAALRHQLWRLTDAAYKSALAGWLEKKARRAVEPDPDGLPDFSPEAPARDEAPTPASEPGDWPERVRALSELFRGRPHLLDGHAYVDLPWTRRWLLTSEGTRIASPAEQAPARLVAVARTRADDGMELESQASWVARAPDGLPSLEEARAGVRTMLDELELDRKAPVQEPIAVPALADPEFSSVLFHEALGHKLEGQRQRDPAQSGLFRDRVGQRILPEFISLYDDPTLEELGGKPSHGGYRYDDEGVAARRAVLVDRGVLKGFLMSRWPAKGFPSSNGHGRAEPSRHPVARMAVLVVEAHVRTPAAELKRRLMRLCRESGKPYGLLLVGAHSGQNDVSRALAQTLEVRPRRILRVDARTGKETPVRGVKLVGTPLTLLNRIVAAGDDTAPLDTHHCGAESGMVPVGQAAPSLLISEAEFQRLPEERARPPVLPSPLER